MTDIPTDHDYLAYSPNSVLPSRNRYALAIISSDNLTLFKADFAVEDGREIISLLPKSLYLVAVQADEVVVVRAVENQSLRPGRQVMELASFLFRRRGSAHWKAG